MTTWGSISRLHQLQRLVLSHHVYRQQGLIRVVCVGEGFTGCDGARRWRGIG